MIIVAAVALLALLALALALVTLARRGDGNAATPLAVDPASGHPLRIEITAPDPGARVRAGDAVTVAVQAFAGYPVARYELWVDGVRTRQSAPADPALSAVARMTWQTGRAGAHVLVARAENAAGLVAQSDPVVVSVAAPGEDSAPPGTVPMSVRSGPGATAEDLATALGVDAASVRLPPGRDLTQGGDRVTVFLPPDRLPPDAAEGDTPQPSPDATPSATAAVTSADASPATPGGGADDAAPLPGGFRRAGDPAPPAAPTSIAARPTGCEVTITWADASGDETGFHLYRFGAARGFQRITTLTAHDGDGSIAFTDRLIRVGHYEYYAAAFNAGGESPGEIAAAEVTDEGCTPTAPAVSATGIMLLQFEAAAMRTGEAWDAAYCYLSLARLEPHMRIPDGDRLFLERSGDGWNIDAWAAGVNRRVFSQDPGAAVDLRIECWASRVGAEPQPLGDFTASHPPADWDGRMLSGVAGGFGIDYRIQPLAAGPRVMYAITDPRIPAPRNLQRGLATDQRIATCHDRADFSGGEDINGLLALWACDEIPEQMLMWDWSGNDTFSRDDISGFRIYYRSEGDPLGDSRFIETTWDVFDDVSAFSQVFPALQPPCNEPYLYEVTAFVVPPGGGEELESPRSESFRLEQRGCDPAAALIEFTLITLEVGLIDDGVSMECLEGILSWICTPAPDFVAESYGQGGFDIVHADGGVTSGYAWGYIFWTHDCGGTGEIFLRGCLSFEPREVESEQTLRWEDEDLSLCQESARCGDFGHGNNVFRLELQDGDRLQFWFNLRDDDLVSDDTWCGTDEDYTFESEIDESKPLVVGPYAIADWAYLFEEITWKNTGAALSDQDAPCTLVVWVNGEGLAP